MHVYFIQYLIRAVHYLSAASIATLVLYQFLFACFVKQFCRKSSWEKGGRGERWCHLGRGFDKVMEGEGGQGCLKAQNFSLRHL